MAQAEKPKLFGQYKNSEGTKMPFDCFTAASNGDLSYFTKYMIGTPENFSAVNKSGWTPIMYASARGHALLVSYMIMCGVKTNCTTKAKLTPLMLAVTSGDLPTVECVFNPADLECKDYRMWSALFYAVYFLQEKCVEFLLSKGANVNVVDFQNETPLIIAVKSGSESMVNLLLRTAKNLDVVSYKNESAIMLAKESNNTKIRDIVLNRSEFLKTAYENSPTVKLMPQKKYLKLNKDNFSTLTPSPVKKNSKHRSFWGLKMSKSFSYSPNNNNNKKTNKMISQSNSPIQMSSDHNKMAFWKMWVTKSPVPTNAQYDVEDLLSSLGLEKYWPIFRDEEVDFETLLTFSEENLKEIGITTRRRKCTESPLPYTEQNSFEVHPRYIVRTCS